MTEGLQMELPWPPSVNHYWRHVRRGKRVMAILTDRAIAYRAAVVSLLHTLGPLKAPVGKRLSVEIIVRPPDRRIRDLDNLPKGILDSLKHSGVYADDSVIDDLRITRGAIGLGTVQVTIRWPV